VKADQTAVTGRVLDAGGKAVARAHVAVVGQYKGDYRIYQNRPGPAVLARGQADRRGRFRLLIPRMSPDRFRSVDVLAGSPGHALARVTLDTDARQPDVAVKLGKEQVVRVRLFDLQGKPARGVKVEVIGLFPPGGGRSSPGFLFHDPPADLPAWPAPATSDEKGRLALRGIGPDWDLFLLSRDGRFARQELQSMAPDRKGDKELTWSLAPARVAEGTVTYADTGKPLANARLTVVASRDKYRGPFYHVDSRTDEKGRFRFVAPVGERVVLWADPPAGQPYLIGSKVLTWPKGAVRLEGVRLTLPRGLTVRGTVTEKPSGRPVARATVEFVRFRDNNPFFNAPGASGVAVSDARGRFELTVVPGPAHLLVKGPTPDYLHEPISSDKLFGRGGGGGRLHYPDAWVALNLKPKSGPHEVAVTLRRGVTVRGRVVGPDGKPVARAELVCRNYIPSRHTLNGYFSRRVKEGRFELPGCDPAKAVQVFFLDTKNRLGAVVDLSGKQAGKPVTVKLRPCGTAKVRFVDARGNPFPDVKPQIGVVLTPGVPFMSNQRGKPLAGVGYPDRTRYRPDAQGRVTLPALIPGAKIWLSGVDGNNSYYTFTKEFTVGAGKTVDLGDVVVKSQREG
jgi:hypothetical protein